MDVILKCDHSNKSCRALLSCGTVYYAVQVGSVLLVSLQVKTTLGCDHSNEKCWEVLSFGAATNAMRISNIVIFLSFLYIFRWSPSCYILLKPSAVWGYTSLRIWDHLTVGRVSASLSRSALNICSDQIEIFRNQVVAVFLRYHTFAPCYSSRLGLGNPGNFCVCNLECRKLFIVESRIQVPLTRNP